ncbi:hypothetical protein LAG90_15690 [Marinilongibacter aquaticus]|uniref:hypothetical protein n=1 Tax=Marinilongibacter aquaticus TaxID=2975157 RepID=UPI0021BD783B|nr:hypothetical protein [Marinilongibacter aquaticus]UBM58246.1 hypothetical protein LAG90_15690 [Marinilongibacter aquaticus]
MKRGKISEAEYENEIQSLEMANVVHVQPQTSAPLRSSEQKKNGENQDTVHEKNGFTAETTQLIAQLQKELNEIDGLKAEKSNSLQYIPKNISATSTVTEILKLREAFVAKGDELRFVKKNGQLPIEKEAEGEFEKDEYFASLPNEKYELDRQIRNLRSQMSKWKKKGETAKSLGKKQEYRHHLVRGELKLSAMLDKLNIL